MFRRPWGEARGEGREVRTHASLLRSAKTARLRTWEVTTLFLKRSREIWGAMRCGGHEMGGHEMWGA